MEGRKRMFKARSQTGKRLGGRASRLNEATGCTIMEDQRAN